MDLQYFKAVSLYRRRNYEKCIKVCNVMLQAGHENNIQMFASNENEEEQQDILRVLLLQSKNIGTSLHGSSSSSSKQQLKNKLRALGNGISGNGSSNASSGSTNNNTRKTMMMPSWMMEGIWQLKMRALTQRIFIDDLETNDDADVANEEVEFERIATAARPGTSIKTAFLTRPSTNLQRQTVNGGGWARTKTGISVVERALPSTLRLRPTSAMARPGTTINRPGTTIATRPASRCGTARHVRVTSATAYNIGDPTAALYQASRVNPTIYAEHSTIIKSLFQFLFYHEGNPQKAYSLCEAAALAEAHKRRQQLQQQQQQQSTTTTTTTISRQNTINNDQWWWNQQRGRCFIAMKSFRKAEIFLQKSLTEFNHPDTILLLSCVYQRLEQSDKALQLILSAVERNPLDVTLRTEQGRIFMELSKPDDAILIYRLIVKLNPIHIEALANIAMNYFYENNPEMALMYYRRILAMGVHTPELHCNIALCCLYGGQIDLMMPCFQRSLMMVTTSEQRADIWYNLSFVAITTGNFTLARRCLRLCLTSDVNNGAALNNLAVLSAQDGNFAKAKSYLIAAKDILIDSTEVESNLNYMEKIYT